MSMIRKVGASFLGVAVIIGVSNCSGERETEWIGTVVDSGGIQLVTNPGIQRARPTAPGWRLDLDMIIDDAEFGNIADVDVDEQGRILVLDGIEKEYRVFDADGTPLFAVGQEGEGPGEFLDPIQILVLPGDSVLVPDVGTGRANVFAPGGQLVRTFRMDRQDLATRRWALEDAGSIVTRRAGPVADVLVRLDGQGEVVDTVASLETGGASTTGRAVVLAPTPIWSPLVGGGFVVGNTHEFSLTLLNSVGHTQTIVRVDENLPVLGDGGEERIKALIRTSMVEQQGLPASVVDNALRSIELSEELPMISGVLAARGRLWVQRALAPEQMDFTRLNVFRTDAYAGFDWELFDQNGRHQGSIAMSAGTQLLSIKGDTVLAVRIGQFGEASVLRYRIVE